MGNGAAFGHSAQVLQASGMVSVQAECTLAEALVMMQERATVQDLTLDEIAAGVIDRSIRFGD